MDEKELIELLRAGDPSAVPLLLTYLGSTCDAYAEAIAGDMAQVDRELAVESALTEVARKIDKFVDQGRGLLPWAKGFVRQALRDARRDAPGRTHLDWDHVPEAEAEPTSDEPRPEATSMVSLMLTVLTEDESALILARLVDNVPYGVLAANAGKSETTMRQRFSRAFRKLKEAARSDPSLRHLLPPEEQASSESEGEP
ncbi:RNA polymerase sigma factor, sigma-70 family [Geodermatophilus amargosae]|uniref:RNA polymerase sigma factor, sigma-70 family n=1 Tax=Geodermatophilus amargosae TaxID=1296565 RepID=A0A1I6ZMS6_9ACTN|nr:sigma-70 family RNA polymerase sigma factor [Geodermatophilus amargosae]SFT63845.1 RNA polymerase sigma factor, sigma-70 family [Geodermatophilus amargosae]